MLSLDSVNRVLTGVRVLDLSTIVAGPAAGMILSDLGAEVIKVERVDRGDDGRDMGPHRGPWGAYFVALNRGKRSIAIDLAKREGRELVLRLAESCDVLIENFRGGKAKALGLDEEKVRTHKPEIIYASLSAYGPSGPDYRKPGYDAVLQARTGIMSVTGNASDGPMRAGVSILDMGAGVWLALGVLAALLERQRSGKGQRVEASLYQTGLLLMAYHLVYRQFAGVNPQPQGSRHTAFAPYGAFRTGDGSMMIGISSDRAFERLCSALDHSEWTRDPRFATNRDRVHNMAALDRVLEDVLQAMPTAHWVALLDKNDIANDAVQNPEQVLHDPQAAALGQFVRVALGGDGDVDLPKVPIGLSLSSPLTPVPPPRLGEHSRAILEEAGCEASEISALIEKGVVGA